MKAEIGLTESVLLAYDDLKVAGQLHVEIFVVAQASVVRLPKLVVSERLEVERTTYAAFLYSAT